MIRLKAGYLYKAENGAIWTATREKEGRMLMSVVVPTTNRRYNGRYEDISFPIDGDFKGIPDLRIVKEIAP